MIIYIKIIIFLFLFFKFINSEQIKIGYLHLSSDSTSSFNYNLLNQLIIINNLSNELELIDLSYGNINNIDEIITDIEEKEILHVFTDELVYLEDDKFNFKSFFIWMAYPFAVKKCTKNVIYYSSLVPIMISRIFFIYLLLEGKVLTYDILDHDIKIYIIEDDNTNVDNNLFDMLKDNLNAYDYYNLEDVNDTFTDTFDEIIDNTKDLVFIWVNRNYNTINSFFGNTNFNPEKHKVYSYVDFDFTQITNDENVKKSTKVFTTYIRNDTDFENIIRADSNHKYDIKDIIYYNSFKMFVEGYFRSKTFAPIALANALYYKRYLIGSGLVAPLPHNFISSSYYLIKYTDSGIELLHSFNPHAYFDPTEAHGNVPLVHCSWQASPTTGKVRISPLVMLFINDINENSVRNYVY